MGSNLMTNSINDFASTLAAASSWAAASEGSEVLEAVQGSGVAGDQFAASMRADIHASFAERAREILEIFLAAIECESLPEESDVLHFEVVPPNDGDPKELRMTSTTLELSAKGEDDWTMLWTLTDGFLVGNNSGGV